jgi:hypothetical protein
MARHDTARRDEMNCRKTSKAANFETLKPETLKPET